MRMFEKRAEIAPRCTSGTADVVSQKDKKHRQSNLFVKLWEMVEVMGSRLDYWLVSHPTVLNFQWREGGTLGSTLPSLTGTVLAYLFLILLSRLTCLLPSFGPRILKPITAFHSLLLLVLSLVMAIGCTLSVLSQAPDLRYVVCFPKGTPPSGPLFFWAYVFYLSKILEFGDTLLIILSKSTRRLTFLHVYHHATVVVMCYVWLHTSQSLFPVALVTNATVHVLMYGYYLLCAVGARPQWKRAVTDCQIVQFVFSFIISILMLYYHFGGTGCEGIWGWCFNAVFNASLLALFVNFHSKSYAGRSTAEKPKQK